MHTYVKVPVEEKMNSWSFMVVIFKKSARETEEGVFLFFAVRNWFFLWQYAYVSFV